jgi:hypothetical protein
VLLLLLLLAHNNAQVRLGGLWMEKAGYVAMHCKVKSVSLGKWEG